VWKQEREGGRLMIITRFGLAGFFIGCYSHVVHRPLTATFFKSLTPMSPQFYLLVFAQAHEDFRVPELRSIAELHGFPLNIANDFDPSRPFGVLALEQEVHARLLARRCILIKWVGRSTRKTSTELIQLMMV